MKTVFVICESSKPQCTDDALLIDVAVRNEDNDKNTTGLTLKQICPAYVVPHIDAFSPSRTIFGLVHTCFLILP